MQPSARPRVVILGGGFGGLAAAKKLAQAPVDVTLFDRRNHHLFQPLLYQVATAGLSPADIAYPIRSILKRQANARVFLATAKTVDPVERTIELLDGSKVAYDYAILATGATHAYFGHDEWAPLAPGLKTLEDAVDIRCRLLRAFESAELEPDPVKRRPLLNFVVVGAGPTGVELAGAISEIARQVMVADFRVIDPKDAKILLVEGGPRVLAAFPEELSVKAKAALEKRGVEVRLSSVVTNIDADGVEIGTERIAAKTVLWAAGVAASPLAKSLGVPLDRAGRVLVEKDLTVPGHPEIYVVGDLAALTQENGKPVPGVAQGALQEGEHAAANLMRTLEGKPRMPFAYYDKGSLATIGRAAAVAEVGRFKFDGLPAWLLWLFVHVLFLVGFRSRAMVLFEWALAYVFGQRTARLITEDDYPPVPSAPRHPRPEVAPASASSQASALSTKTF